MKCNAFWPKFNVVLCRRSALIMYTKGFCSLLGLIILRCQSLKPPLKNSYIQWRAIQTVLLSVYDVKWGLFERAKMTLKMLLASKYSKDLFKRFRSFNTVNMGSVGQRASKLLAVKVEGFKKKVCQLAPATLKPVSPSSTVSGIKSFSKFDGL